MNSFIPWVGGKGKLLWIINKLMPDRYTRFIDVFGGSGTVTMCRPIQRGCIEVYNDFNSNLTNLFCCVKNRPMALLAELGFLPLNTRDDFNVLYKFFSKGEFTDDYLQEEMDLTEVYLKPPDAEAIRALMLERAPRGSIRRAADFFKLIRYSFSGGAKSFGGKPCDIRRFFHLIWECSRRLANVIVENKDFEEVIRQYDRAGAVIYCDPPYYKAESCYEVEFPPEDHQRLHDVLVTCEGLEVWWIGAIRSPRALWRSASSPLFRSGFMSCAFLCRGPSLRRSPATGHPSGMWPARSCRCSTPWNRYPT